MEWLDNRFGVVDVKCGFIAPEQLLEAIQIQVYEDLEGAKHRLIQFLTIREQKIKFFACINKAEPYDPAPIYGQVNLLQSL